MKPTIRPELQTSSIRSPLLRRTSLELQGVREPQPPATPLDASKATPWTPPAPTAPKPPDAVIAALLLKEALLGRQELSGAVLALLCVSGAAKLPETILGALWDEEDLEVLSQRATSGELLRDLVSLKFDTSLPPAVPPE